MSAFLLAGDVEARSLFPDARGSGRIPPPSPRTHILEEDVGIAIITVELVVVTDGTGGVRVASLVGDTPDQYQSYDTLLAWRLLLDALRPDRAGEVDPGRFDPAVVERGGRLRGTVHLP